MMPRGRFKTNRLSPIAMVIAIAFAGPFFMASTIGIRINLSPSLPLGLYRKTFDVRARLVEFCPEEPYARIAMERGYRSTGNCPDGGAPLMKPVIATARDKVEVSSLGISLNGSPIPNTAPMDSDTEGRPLRPWPFGTIRVPDGFVWVASSYNTRSYDSRYFGPVSEHSIRSHLTPFLTFR